MRRLKKVLWPHKVIVQLPDHPKEDAATETWLGANMGALRGRWNVVYNYTTTDYYFREIDDAVMFKLTCV